ncbi:MAG: M48 family metallopeptidase [Oscillospiraceae bacterium]
MPIDYTLIRSRRKTISLSFDREGNPVVRCPLRMAKYHADAFVEGHADWITKHQSPILERIQKRADFSFADGQLLPFLGREYTIATLERVRKPVISGERILLPSGDSTEREAAFSSFLYAQAKEYLPSRVAVFQTEMAVNPGSLRISSARTRWGSCSGKGNISFSRRLLCLPPHLIDYVVVHELAHLLQHNHSPLFYAEVAQVLPDYKQRQREIRAITLPF